MDGKGRWMDNVIAERFWRSIKYEEIHLKEYQTPAELYCSVKQYINFYNNKRFHEALKYKTPAQIYFKNIN